jgi:hypothetical protein
MTRRAFIALIGGAAAAWPLAARAQQSAMPEVGVLLATSPDTYVERLRAFRQGLRENGYVEGENVTIVYRSAEGHYDRLPGMAAELVHRQVAVIAAVGAGPSVSAAKSTTMIPIVFGVGEDPVRLGLVASLARPSSNVTGVNFFQGELTAKRLELLRMRQPRIRAGRHRGALMRVGKVAVTTAVIIRSSNAWRPQEDSAITARRTHGQSGPRRRHHAPPADRLPVSSRRARLRWPPSPRVERRGIKATLSNRTAPSGFSIQPKFDNPKNR